MRLRAFIPIGLFFALAAACQIQGDPGPLTGGGDAGGATPADADNAADPGDEDAGGPATETDGGLPKTGTDGGDPGSPTSGGVPGASGDGGSPRPADGGAPEPPPVQLAPRGYWIAREEGGAQKTFLILVESAGGGRHVFKRLRYDIGEANISSSGIISGTELSGRFVTAGKMELTIQNQSAQGKYLAVRMPETSSSSPLPPFRAVTPRTQAGGKYRGQVTALIQQNYGREPIPTEPFELQLENGSLRIQDNLGRFVTGAFISDEGFGVLNNSTRFTNLGLDAAGVGNCARNGSSCSLIVAHESPALGRSPFALFRIELSR
ncbi:MAG: hypothetical protein GMKNLPBB_01486 [Myxococcota bacterium]|nr:hypothetical protein [Myxococcota bacterium]